MFGKKCALAIMLALPIQSAFAQSAPVNANVAQIPLEQMCNSGGALGLTFGTTEHGVKPSHRPGFINRDLPVEFGPFKQASIGVTKYSRRFASVVYTADITSEAEASKARAALVARFKAAGWKPVIDPETEEMEAGGPPEEVRLFAGADPESGATITISQFGLELTTECAGGAIAQSYMDEAFGKMPDGMPKPVFMPDSANFPWTAADCDDPAKRGAIEKAMGQEDMMGAMPGADRVRYEEALADWKIMKLTSSGKIEREELVDKIIGLIDSPDSKANIEKSMGVLDSLDKIDPNDPSGMCRGMISTLTKTNEIFTPKPGATGDAITPQWQGTHALLDKEAKRLGVSFAE